MAYARANSDKLNMAHAGVGSITHFTGLLLNALIGINPTLVPFTGSAPAINPHSSAARACDLPEKAQRGPRPLAALVKSEIARWTPIIEAANAK